MPYLVSRVSFNRKFVSDQSIRLRGRIRWPSIGLHVFAVTLGASWVFTSLSNKCSRSELNNCPTIRVLGVSLCLARKASLCIRNGRRYSFSRIIQPRSRTRATFPCVSVCALGLWRATNSHRCVGVVVTYLPCLPVCLPPINDGNLR